MYNAGNFFVFSGAYLNLGDLKKILIIKKKVLAIGIFIHTPHTQAT